MKTLYTFLIILCLGITGYAIFVAEQLGISKLTSDTNKGDFKEGRFGGVSLISLLAAVSLLGAIYFGYKLFKVTSTKTLRIIGAVTLFAVGGFSAWIATNSGINLHNNNYSKDEIPLNKGVLGGFTAVSLVSLAGAGYLSYKVIK